MGHFAFQIILSPNKEHLPKRTCP